MSREVGASVESSAQWKNPLGNHRSRYANPVYTMHSLGALAQRLASEPDFNL